MKLQVSVSDTMVEKIDFCAEYLGITRSAFCSMLIGGGVMDWRRKIEIEQGQMTIEENN